MKRKLKAEEAVTMMLIAGQIVLFIGILTS